MNKKILFSVLGIISVSAVISCAGFFVVKESRPMANSSVNEKIQKNTDRLVEQGDPKAQYDKYSSLQGPGRSTKEKAEAIRLLKLSAQQDYGPAQYDLARLFNNAYYKKDYNPQEAFNLFKKAAKNGSPHAWYEIALMYREGTGVEKDFSKSYEILETLAILKNLEATSARGVISGLYEVGDKDKFKQSYSEAYKWILTADYDTSAIIKRLKPQLSEEEINQAASWADDFKRKFPVQEYHDDIEIVREIYKDNNSIEANYKLGMMYLNGDRVVKNMQYALNNLESSAEHGHAQSRLELARIYKNGSDEISPDEVKSYFYYLSSELKDEQLETFYQSLSEKVVVEAKVKASNYTNKYPLYKN